MLQKWLMFSYLIFFTPHVHSINFLSFVPYHHHHLYLITFAQNVLISSFCHSQGLTQAAGLCKNITEGNSPKTRDKGLLGMRWKAHWHWQLVAAERATKVHAFDFDVYMCQWDWHSILCAYMSMGLKGFRGFWLLWLIRMQEPSNAHVLHMILTNMLLHICYSKSTGGDHNFKAIFALNQNWLAEAMLL